MSLSCQRGGTQIKILCQKVCGPLTSGCQVCRHVLPFFLLQSCQIIVISEADFFQVLCVLEESVLVIHRKAHVLDVACSDLGSVYPDVIGSTHWVHLHSFCHLACTRP